MSYQFIAQGSLLDAGNMASYEPSILEGQRGILTLTLRIPAGAETASHLQRDLQNRGVTDARVFADGNDLSIEFRKAFPWLAVIVAAILGLIVLAVLIVGWRLFKDVAAVLPAPILAGGSIILIALAGLVAWKVATR